MNQRGKTNQKTVDLTAEGSGDVTSNEASLCTLFSFKETLFNYVCFLWHLAYKLQSKQFPSTA